MKHSTLDLAKIQTPTPHKSLYTDVILAVESVCSFLDHGSEPSDSFFYAKRNLGLIRHDVVPSALPFNPIPHLNRSSTYQATTILCLIESVVCNSKTKATVKEPNLIGLVETSLSLNSSKHSMILSLTCLYLPRITSKLVRTRRRSARAEGQVRGRAAEAVARRRRAVMALA